MYSFQCVRGRPTNIYVLWRVKLVWEAFLSHSAYMTKPSTLEIFRFGKIVDRC